MDLTNSFDHWLELPGVRRQSFIVDASVEARDTLVGCWHAANSVFGDSAKPEHALMLLPLVLQRADAARRQARETPADQTDA